MAEYSNSKYEITTIADCIYKVKPFEGSELDESDIREMRAIYLELSEGKSFAILLDATNNFTPTTEARVLLASEEFAKKRIAGAFVVNTLANKILGNFFIKVNKPFSPTKLFTDEASALEWLKEKMKAH